VKVTKPWGHYEVIFQNEQTTIKILFVKKGHRTSLQFHELRSEKWLILDGTGMAQLHDDKIQVEKGGILSINKFAKHRIQAHQDMLILEASFGNFDEFDIYRLEDDYDRCSNGIKTKN